METNFRKTAEDLWSLLDDIDTLGDAIKPNDYSGFLRYYEAVHRVLRKRFKYFNSDGYKLYTQEEWEKFKQKQIDELMKNYKKQ